jgi:hypothetical protein
MQREEAAATPATSVDDAVQAVLRAYGMENANTSNRQNANTETRKDGNAETGREAGATREGAA